MELTYSDEITPVYLIPIAKHYHTYTLILPMCVHIICILSHHAVLSNMQISIQLMSYKIIAHITNVHNLYYVYDCAGSPGMAT